VGLVARSGSDLITESFRRVEHFLRDRQVEVLVEDSALPMLIRQDAAVCSRETMGERCDLVIAVGGDGNMLGAARSLVSHGVPILGVNRGRLGFLADVSPEEIEISLGSVLAGDFTVEEHFLLEGDKSPDDNGDLPCALNEVVIHAANLPKMLEFNLYIDEAFVFNQYSDGLIVSTPTGSTAYALSAGGPIMHPSLDAIALVPMFPHSLNSRPLVVKGESSIRVEIGSHVETHAKVSFDSQIEFDVGPGESITVRKKKERLKLIHPPGHNFYEVCRSKLDWASRMGE
ncbi:MAG: NAD(+) kinase, partial [Gammaproteobacteria bacterium]|nr:NAD(+) kinase [Gammaproteobacteria bacterium]